MGLDLKPLVSASVANLKLSELRDKVIAIDAYNTIYQFLSTIRGPTGEPLSNSRGEVTSHLSGLFYRTVNLMIEDIKTIFVFDGKPHMLKTSELQKRNKLKQEATEKYQLAIQEGRNEDALKFGKRTSVLDEKIKEESKLLCTYLGVPVVQAPSDGESMAAYLTKTGNAFAAASQDYDSILFGAKRLIRNIAISGRRKIPNKNSYFDVEPEMLDHDLILKNLSLKHEQLIDVGILIGTDFNPGGFQGIGPKTALKLIRENGRLENIEKIKPLLSEVPYQEIRNIFLSQELPQTGNLEFGSIQREKLLDFLCVEKGFSADRVSGTLDKLEKADSNKSQSLEKWFN
jgi:flap endonuclease-1